MRERGTVSFILIEFFLQWSFSPSVQGFPPIFFPRKRLFSAVKRKTYLSSIKRRCCRFGGPNGYSAVRMRFFAFAVATPFPPSPLVCDSAIRMYRWETPQKNHDPDFVGMHFVVNYWCRLRNMNGIPVYKSLWYSLSTPFILNRGRLKSIIPGPWGREIRENTKWQREAGSRGYARPAARIANMPNSGIHICSTIQGSFYKSAPQIHH